MTPDKVHLTVTDTAYLTLAESLADLFSRRGEKMLQSLAQMRGFRECVLEIYRLLRRLGELTEIENLPDQHKQELWVRAKRLWVAAEEARDKDLPGEPPQWDPETGKDICRALHALGTALLLSDSGKLQAYLKSYKHENTTPHPQG